MNDQTSSLQHQIISAYKHKTACKIEGGNSKSFIGNESNGEIISTQQHNGIISYDASELVVTVRSGTTLKKIEQTLAEKNQMLAFEPPAFSENSTIGGTIACNLSGPSRPYTGAARDFILGSKIINGKGEILQFGGQVMKNVAGYDASRLMAGAYGTLGLILDISLKVLPKPDSEITIKIEQPVNTAINTINSLSAKNLPISASYYLDQHLYIRVNSSEKNTQAASQIICKETAGIEISDSEIFWQQIRHQKHDFFNTDLPIARLSVPATNNNIEIEGEQLIEWGGALRWLKTNTNIEEIRQMIKPLKGHATAYKNFNQETEYFQPLDSNLKIIHQRLKKAFDPAIILNPGRLYKEL